MPSNFNFAEYAANRRANDAAAQAQQQSSSNAGGFNFQDFLQQKQLIDQAAAQINGNAPWWVNENALGGRGYNQGSLFQMNRGTDSMYDSYRKAMGLDSAALAAREGGDWWNNLAGEVAGALGGEQAKKDWTFDDSKFNIFNGIDTDDLVQVRNFAANLPGMLVGGPLTGISQAYEALSGSPIHEAEKDANGTWEIPDYQLDTSQRAAQALNAGINIFGTFTGGAGRVVGALGKRAMSTAGKKAAGALEALGRGDTDIARFGFESAEEAMRKAERANRRIERLQDMSKGVVTRALEGTTGKELSTGLGLVADMGDEAAEEFVQQYLDDTRMKTLDEGTFGRAVQGAAWGAFGGLLMGGTGRAIGSGVDAVQNRLQRAISDNGEPPTTNAYTVNLGESALSVNKNMELGDFILPSEGVEALDEGFSNETKQPGSAIFLQTGTDSNMGLRDLGLGTDQFKYSFMNDDASAKVMSDLLGGEANGASVEEIAQHVRNDTSQDLAQWLNSKLASDNNAGRVLVGRNPDTSNGGMFMKIKEFRAGSAFVAHPMTMSYVGSDWDGDRASVYFNVNTKNISQDDDRMAFTPYGSINQHLLDFNARKSTVDWAFAGIDNTTAFGKREQKNAKATLRKIFSDAGYDGVVVIDDSIIDDFVEGISNAVNNNDISGDERNYLVSLTCSNFITAVNQARGNKTNLPDADRIFDEVIKQIFGDENIISYRKVVRFANRVADSIDDANFMTDDEKAKMKEMLSSENVKKRWEVRGTTGGSQRMGQMQRDLGLILYLLDPNAKYNPLYRQYGLLRYEVNSIPAFAQAMINMGGIDTTGGLMKSLIRGAFKLTDAQTTPLNAIEGVLDTLAKAEIAKELTLSRDKLRYGDSVSKFYDAVESIQEKYAKLYGKVIGELTLEGYEIPPGSSYQNTIASLDGNARISARNRYITRVFKNEKLDMLLDRAILERLNLLDEHGECYYTLGEFLEKYSKYAYKDNIDLKLKPIKEVLGPDGKPMYDDVFKFVRSLVNGYQSETTALVAKIEALIKEIDTSGVLKRFNETINDEHPDGELVPGDVPVLMSLFNIVYDFVGAKNAMDIGIVISPEFLNSQAGRMLLSGDPSQILNLLCASSVYSQYTFLIDALTSNDPSVQISAQEQILQLGSISPLHEELSNTLLSDPSSPNLELFNLFTSLDVSLSEKLLSFENVFGIKYDKSDFVLNCFQTEAGAFAISSVSARVTKAQQALNSMRKRAKEACIDEVNELIDTIDSIGSGIQQGVDFTDYVKYLAKESTVKYHDSMMSLKVIASLTLNNSYVEKATIADILSAMYNMNVIGTDGGLMSELDVLIAEENGQLTFDQWIGNRRHFLSCVTDPSYSCYVFDENTGITYHMTQENLFKIVSPGYSGDGLSWSMLKQIMRKYPQTAGYFCQHTVNASTYNGMVGVQLAREDSVLESFRKWNKPRRTTSGEATTREQLTKQNVDRMLEKIRSIMFRSPQAQYLITLSIPPSLLEGKIDGPKLNKAVTSAIDDWSYYFMHRLLRMNISTDKIVPGSFESMETRDNFQLASSELAEDILNMSLNILDYEKDNMTAEMQNLADEKFASMMAEMLVLGELREEFNPGEEDDLEKSISGKLLELEELQKATFRITALLSQRAADDQRERIREKAYGLYNNDFIIEKLMDANKSLTREEAQGKIIGAIETLTDSTLDQSDVTILNADDMKFIISADSMSDIDYSGNLDTVNRRINKARNKLRQEIEEIVKWNPEYTKKNKGVSFVDVLVEKVYPDPVINKDGSISSPFRDDQAARDAKDQVVRDVNNISITHEILTVSRIGGLAINENVPQLLDEARGWHDGFFSELKKAMGPSGDLWEYFLNYSDLIDSEIKRRHSDPSTMPKIYPYSQTMQASISNQKANDTGASNPTAVGVNGGMGRVSYPLGYIPDFVRDISEAVASSVKVEDIDPLWIIDHGNDWVIILGENEPITISSAAFENFYRNAAAGDEFVFFNPDDNPHGLPTYNMSAPESDPRNTYHRLSGIIGALIDASQEANVLKTKKLLRVAEWLYKSRGLGNFQIADNTRNNSAINGQELLDLFTGYRRSFAESIANDFANGTFKGVGLNRNDAFLLAAFFTPGMKITIRNTQTGVISNTVIDANHFFGADPAADLDIILSDRRTQGYEILAAEPFCISPTMASWRILDAINDEREITPDLSKSDIERIAYNALNNWDGFNLFTDDIEAVLDRIPPVEHAHKMFMRVEDSPSHMQWLGDLVWDEAYGNIGYSHAKSVDLNVYNPKTNPGPEALRQTLASRIIGGKSGNDVNENDVNEPVERQLENLLNRREVEDEVLDIGPVFQVWAGPIDASSFGPEMLKLKRLVANYQKENSRNENLFATIPAPGCGLCLDIDAFDQAMSWAKRTNQRLFVPNENRYRKLAITYGKSVLGNTINIDGVELIELNPAKDVHWAAVKKGPVISEQQIKTTDDILTCGIVPSSMVRAGDANGIAFEHTWNQVTFDEGTKTYLLSDILPGAHWIKKRMVEQYEAKQLLETIAEYDNKTGEYIPSKDDTVWKNAGFDFGAIKDDHLGKSDNLIRQKVVDFLVKQSNSYNNAMEDHARSYAFPPIGHEVACLVTDGYRIVPILNPPNIPYNEDGRVYHCFIAGNTLNIEYSGTSPMFSSEIEGSQKRQLAGETFKMMMAKAARYINGKLAQILPAPKLSDSKKLDFIASSETEGSRVGGMDELLLCDSLHYRRALEDCSLFYTKTVVDVNGKQQVVYSLKPEIAAWEEKAPELWRIFVSQASMSRSDWEKILDNTALEFPGGENNRSIIVEAIKACLDHGLDPRDAFSNYKLIPETDEDGNILRDANRNNSIRYKRVSPMQANDMSISSSFTDFNNRSVLQYLILEPDKLLRLYYSIDERLCPNGLDDDSRSREEYWIDQSGLTLVDFGEYEDALGTSRKDFKDEFGRFSGNGKTWLLIPVRYGQHKVLGEETLKQAPSPSSSLAYQHMGRRGLDNGIAEPNIGYSLAYNNASFGDYRDAIRNSRARRASALRHPDNRPSFRIDPDLDLESAIKTGSLREVNQYRRIIRNIEKTFSIRRKIVDSSGEKTIEEYMATEEGREEFATTELYKAINNFNSLMSDEHKFTIDMIDDICKCAKASSWTGTGRFEVTFRQLTDAINEITENLRNGKVPITCKYTDSADNSDRYNMCLLPRDIAIWIWNGMDDDYRHEFGSFENFKNEMAKEQTKSEQAISESLDATNFKDKARKTALCDFARGLRMSWGDTSTLLPVFDDFFIEEIRKDGDAVAKTFATAYNWTQDQWDVYNECCKQSEEVLHAMITALEKRRTQKLTYDRGAGEEAVIYTKQREAAMLANILNNAAELSKVMALVSPFVMAGNTIDRIVHQGIANVALKVGSRLRRGLYAVDESHEIKNDILDKAINDPLAQKLYISYRLMEFSSSEKQMLATIIKSKNMEALEEFLENRKKEIKKTDPRRWAEWMYKASSGFDVGMKMQMSLALRRFVMFAEEENHFWWFEDTPVKDSEGNTMNRLNAMLASDNGFTDFFLWCMGNEGVESAPDFMAWSKAMNWAKQGDLAQKNALGMVLSDLCARVPFANFGVTTTISKFPMYGLNVTGRALNYLLPMSSLNYMFTRKLASTDYGRSLGIEGAQIHTSLREALLVDLCKMGIGGLALVLFGISGAVEPPDDEDKWGNIDEWLLFGWRAGDSWWMEDIMGMALPMAAFWKSVQLGKPRFDIITNGIRQACYANPLMRTSDLASWILDPLNSVVSDYAQDVASYEKARGGSPDLGAWAMTNAFSFGMNWVAQFATPSILKELWTASQPYEKSHNRAYKRTAAGTLSAEGAAGETEYLSYEEAQIRRLAKRNPWFALLYSNFTGTSIMPNDMPNTVYYDDYQLDAIERTSVVGLEGAEREAKIMQIIATLQAYSDMDALAADGFFLDGETLRAVADTVWDSYHEVDVWFNNLRANGQLDYYYLGNGSYTEGQRAYGEIVSHCNSMKQFWYDFYYTKLKDSPIAGTMQTYNRYNTTYAEDVNGNVYATGIRKFPFNILPITSAPGTVDNPAGTAGYENDFMSISAVTNAPLSQRALVPNPTEDAELPKFEELSSDGNGGDYSNSRKSQASSSPTGTLSTSSTGTPSGSGYPRSSGVGGSRSGGSGVGGGGSSRGYTPNVYAPSVSLPKGNASRIMNRDRLNRPQYDYLRPDFETKGSREAYKRSDI